MNLLWTIVLLKRREPIRRKVRVGMKPRYREARRHGQSADAARRVRGELFDSESIISPCGTHKRHTVSKNLGLGLRMFVVVCFVDCQWASYRKIITI